MVLTTVSLHCCVDEFFRPDSSIEFGLFLAFYCDNPPTIEAYDEFAHKRAGIFHVSQQRCAYFCLSCSLPPHRYPDIGRRSFCVMRPLSSKLQLPGRCGSQNSSEKVRISFVQGSTAFRSKFLGFGEINFAVGYGGHPRKGNILAISLNCTLLKTIKYGGEGGI